MNEERGARRTDLDDTDARPSADFTSNAGSLSPPGDSPMADSAAGRTFEDSGVSPAVGEARLTPARREKDRLDDSVEAQSVGGVSEPDSAERDHVDLSGDPYIYPRDDLGAEGVLRNKAGITDPHEYETWERKATGVGAQKLKADPPDVTERTAADLVCHIHRRLFGDVFDWAGEHRRIGMRKPDSQPFMGPKFISDELDEIGAFLRSRNHFEGIADGQQYAQNMAIAWGSLNHAHPFREGNGRTTRIFLDTLARHTARKIDWSMLSEEENITVSEAAVSGGNPWLMVDAVKRIASRYEPSYGQGGGAAPPVSDGEAHRIIAEINASNLLEGIVSDDDEDSVAFDALTGRITEAEQWARLRDLHFRDHPHSPQSVRDYFDGLIERAGAAR